MLHHHARRAVDCVYESNLCSQIVLWRSFRIFVRIFPLDMLDKHLRQRDREVQKCAYPHRNFPKAALPRWCYPCMLIHERFLLSISRLACFSIVVCVFPLVPGNDTKSFILDVACENVHISGVFFRMQHYTAIEWAVDIYTQAIYALNLFFYCSFRIDVWVFSAHAGTDAK